MIHLLIALFLVAFYTTAPRVAWHLPTHHPRVAHFLPYRFNNSLRAARKAKKLKFKYSDKDIQVTRDWIVVVTHWDNLKHDQFTWIWTGKKILGVEVRKRYTGTLDIDHLDWSVVSRLRSSRVGGYRIYGLQPHMNALHKAGITFCAELKNNRLSDPRCVKQFMDAQKVTGCRVIIMTLQSLLNGAGILAPLRRLAPYKLAGFPTVILKRGHKPADWDKVWAPIVDAAWGGSW